MDTKTTSMVGLGTFVVAWSTLTMSGAGRALEVLGAESLQDAIPALLVGLVLQTGLGLAMGIHLGLRSPARLAVVAAGAVSAPVAALGVPGPLGVAAAATAVLGAALPALARRRVHRQHRGASPA